jgi:hypothetical protein
MKKSHMIHLSFWCFVLFLTIASQLAAAPAFKWGFQERLRNEFMNNNVDFNADKDDKQDFYRVRTSLWGQYDFSSKLSVRVQINNEFRHYTDTRVTDAGRENTGDEIIFEHLFLKYTTGSQNPVTVTLGRQNLMYGEGFILMDGGPWDGSRTIYHDAAKISYKKGDVTYDLLGISNPQYDYRLPKLRFTETGGKYLGLPKNYDGHQLMNDGLEEALGLYITKKPATGTQLEGYYFYKVEQPEYALPAFQGITAAQKSRLNLHTVGGRVVHPLAANLKLLTEWAYQTGGQAENKISAYGGYANLAYTLLPKKNGVLTAGFNLLSGDDPKTADVEGWNPLFSRWPKWSELYIYSQTAENNGGGRKIAYWTNTFSPNIKFDIAAHSKLDVTLWLHHLKAFQSSASGTGKTRGSEFQLWLKFKFTKQLTGVFLYDYFLAGDFYAAPRANAAFIRGELMYTLQ